MPDHVDAPFVLLPGQGRAIDLGNFVMSLKASGAETGGAFALLEATEPANFGPPLHIHTNAAEAFYVLEGEYIIFIEGREHMCSAGSFVYIPSGVRHGFRVGDRPSRKLNLYTPAAMVGYFDELSAQRDRPTVWHGGARSGSGGLSLIRSKPFRRAAIGSSAG